ncbi:alkaline phosphatase [Actinomyces haliotis]|uniref:alkaline phosphatase n=1 Tax=Actinomyces haliotis TaxID=1280843 RepID=UPI001E51E0C4|nr:alkaline phosphatase [Actinomyces haliotis]
MKLPHALRLPARVGTAIAAAGAMAIPALALPAASAATSTTHDTNGPAHCVTTSADGTLNTDPGSCAQYGTAGQGRSNEHAKNVILIIGDGMGQQEITAARNYVEGAGGRFAGLDNLTSTGLYTHYSINKDGSVNDVTDSAASGTAWATGTKTYNGAIGVDVAGNPEENLIEVAKNAGLRTGNVSTAEIQDATPAVLGAHASTRSCYAPSGSKSTGCDADQRVNGGLGSIEEQIVDTRADVTLGGGAQYFDAAVQADSGNTNPFLTGSALYDTQWKAGTSVLDNAKANGYQVVTNASELDAVTSADQEHPVLGLFASGNMTRAYAKSEAVLGGSTGAPITCQKNDVGDEPEAVAMTNKAISLLDQPASDKGFFLQVESASIDKADHDADACGQIGETERLDQVVQAAVDFAKADGNTMVVVTADHSHTSQIVYDDTDLVAPSTRLLTKDGATMSLAYGTSTVDSTGHVTGSQQHTGAQLRVAAYGPGSENVIGQTDQTDLHFTIRNALGLGVNANPNGTDDGLADPVDTDGVNDTCYLVQADGTVASAPGACAQYGKSGEQRSSEKAKNVILFIGDGMGDSEITSARNYLYGAGGVLPGLDALKYTGSYTHFSLQNDHGTIKPNYVTDSAASGTAWATGTKTYNGAIGVDLAGNALPNLLELAKESGLRTGNVTTAEIEDATPAVEGAHVSTRSCYSPSGYKSDCVSDQRVNGGLGSIAEQLVDTRADVTLGGGSKAFDQTVQASGTYAGSDGDHVWTSGSSVLDNAKAQGYQVVTNASELDAVTSADQDAPVLGLFASGNMPRKFLRTTPTTDGALQDAQSCELNPERTSATPDLAAMTTKAIDLLDRSGAGDDTGFFLQVEGASIDKADHDADACGQIGELDDLDQAIQAARSWVAESGEPTLIIATADHAHTSQITEDDVLTAGLTTKLRTADGSDMVLNYATASSNGDEALGGQNHTGAQLRIAAEGPGAENVVGQTDQTDMHYTVANALGLDTTRTTVDNGFTLTSMEPTAEPTDGATATPTATASAEPSREPSTAPSPTPSAAPSTTPSPADSVTPSASASSSPTATASPSASHPGKGHGHGHDEGHGKGHGKGHGHGPGHGHGDGGWWTSGWTSWFSRAITVIWQAIAVLW